MMRTICIISLLAVAAFMILAQPAIADDLADLKAAHQMLIKGWNTGDAEIVYQIWQDGGIWVPITRGFPEVTNTARSRVMFTKWFETHMFRSKWYKVDYKVIGNTGLVYGLREFIIIVKANGTGKRYFVKTTVTWVKSGGKWGAVMHHDTPLQSEVDIF